MKKIACLAVCFALLFAAHLQAANVCPVKGCPAIELGGHTGEIQFVAFSPLGQRVVTIDDHFVRIWHARTGRLLRMLRWCMDVDPTDGFSSNAKRFVTLDGNTVKIWHTKTGRLLRVLQWCSYADDIEFVALSPNGTKIVTVNMDNDVQVWNVQSGRLLRGLRGYADPVESAAVSPLGKRIVTISGDTVLIWTLP